MRFTFVAVAIAACSLPTYDPPCPSGEEQCGIDGPCFDPTTTQCCGAFLSGGDLCTRANQSCAPTSPGSFDSTCQPDAWYRVACASGPKSPTYRGSYDAQISNEAIVDLVPAHEYELQFAPGCGASSGSATVTFDGTAHVATWTANATDAGPLTFTDDLGLALVAIAVRSLDAAGFSADVTDANGTHAVAFARVN
jgi:hypothetical protein